MQCLDRLLGVVAVPNKAIRQVVASGSCSTVAGPKGGEEREGEKRAVEPFLEDSCNSWGHNQCTLATLAPYRPAPRSASPSHHELLYFNVCTQTLKSIHIHDIEEV